MKSNISCTDGVKKAAKIYREAAREIERRDDSSFPAPLAIKRAEGKGVMEDSLLVDKLKEMYAGDTYPFWPWTIEKNRRDLRILALCFMAAMIAAGDA